MHICFIGFGEAGGLIAAGLAAAGAQIPAAYDVLFSDSKHGPALSTKARSLGIAASASIAEAVAGADIVISAVTCTQTVAASVACAPYLRAGQVYLDINSASPMAKREAALAIEAHGASFVDAAVMDLVPPHGHKVPMLLAGRRAQETAVRLRGYEMKVSVIGDAIGDASAVKMVRSVFMKGFSAILLECLFAASALGAEEVILQSLQVTYPQFDWNGFADRSLSRLIEHGQRQAEEMYAATETLEDLGIAPITALASARRLQWFANQDLADRIEVLPAPYADILKALRQGPRTG